MDTSSTDDIVFFEIFPWNENFNTHIEKIDQQHKKLVYIVNKLAAHLANLSGDIVLNDIFDELVDYTDYHFKTEEGIWSQNFQDDVWFLEHEKTHDSFIAKVLDLKENKENKPFEVLITDLVSFLAKWLAYHILDTDKRMAKAVLAIQKGIPIAEAKELADSEMKGAMQVLIHTVLDMYDSLSSRTLDLMKEKSLRRIAEAELLKSEERWQFILEHDVDKIWDWNVHEENLSQSFQETQFSQVHQDDKERVLEEFQAHVEGDTDFFSSKYRLQIADGSWSWIVSRAKVVAKDSNDNPIRIVGVNSDVTERELAAIIHKHSSQAMMITDAQNHIININPAYTQITGYSFKDVQGKNPKFMSAGNEKHIYHKMWKAINEEGFWEGELYNKHKNGQTYIEHIRINSVKDIRGNVENYVGLFSDVTERKRQDALILEQANFDSLTKLYNRRTFKIGLEKEIEKAERFHGDFALFYIDLDRFKEVNDSLGHEIGDLLLIEVSDRLRSCVRKSDIVSRLGGDEFSVILSQTTASVKVDTIAQEILKSLSSPYAIGDNKIHISASLGISLYPNDAKKATSLLVNADQAMYLAKKSGRNRYRYFTLGIQKKAEQRHAIISDLYRAIEENEFEVYYQAIEDIREKKIYKAEALVRWNHPTKGVIYPDDFITLAEQSGLIVQIDNFVFKEAAKQIKIWQENYGIDFQISINKSPVQFKEAHMLNEITHYLKHIDLSTQSVTIEVTENAFIEDIESMSALLASFKKEGFSLSLDDFGTGYSSLSYLRKFHIGILKIDKSFVLNIIEDKQDLALCEAIISMAHKLGIHVIAEGVETEAHKKLLEDLECDFAQGYVHSKPIPANDFEAYFKKYNGL